MGTDGLRVCLITAEYPPQIGGLADYTRNLAKALLDLDQRVTVLTSATPAGQATDHAHATGTANKQEPAVLASVPRWDFRIFHTIRQVIDRVQPTTLHIQYQTAGYGMHPAINLLPRWLNWRRPGVSIVTTFHDVREPYLFPKAGPLRSWVTRQLVLGSHGAIATNPEDAIALRRMIATQSTSWSASRPRLAGIPIGSNILPPAEESVDSTAQRRAWDIPKDAYVLGHFGLLNHTKGIETLFQALRLLLDRGLPVFLAMLGEEVGASDPTNRAYREKVKGLAITLNLVQRVVWTGYLSEGELSRAFSALDCCLLPYAEAASYRHGTLLAALAHGVPVVTTRSRMFSSEADPSQEEFPCLQDGLHCRLVAPGDAAALAAATISLLEDAPLRSHLATGGRSLAAQFSWSAIARRTASFYQDVLADRMGGAS